MSRPKDDDGFTLLEVIVALALVGIVATAALAFTIRGMRDSSSIDQRQGAVTAATQVMEQVRAIAAIKDSAGDSGLVAGRSLDAVNAQWTAAGSTATADMWPAYDSTATASSTPTLKLNPDTVVGGTTYHVATLIGTCYRPRATTAAATTAGAPAACTKQTTTQPASTDTTYVAMDRVVVLVSWAPLAASSCAATSCSYSTTALVDPNGDLTWNQSTTVKAVDDAVTVSGGSTTTISVLGNDIGSPMASNPVSITSSPSAGSASVDSSGVITYVAGSSGGTVTLQYTFTSTTGVVSNTATVTITVQAKPVAGTYSVSVPSTVANPPSAVDLGILAHATNADSASTVTIVNAATSTAGNPGSLSTSGAAALLTPAQSTIGKRTFTYTITDNGMTSNTGTVTVSVFPAAGAYTQSGRAGSAAQPVKVPAVDLALIGGGQTQLSSYNLPPSACGSINQSGSSYTWTPPATVPPSSTSCVLSYTQKGNVSGTSDLTASSTLTFTVTP